MLLGAQPEGPQGERPLQSKWKSDKDTVPQRRSGGSCVGVCVCVCVCVCARAHVVCERASARACVRVCWPCLRKAKAASNLFLS